MATESYLRIQSSVSAARGGESTTYLSSRWLLYKDVRI